MFSGGTCGDSSGLPGSGPGAQFGGCGGGDGGGGSGGGVGGGGGGLTLVRFTMQTVPGTEGSVAFGKREYSSHLSRLLSNSYALHLSGPATKQTFLHCSSFSPKNVS